MYCLSSQRILREDITHYLKHSSLWLSLFMNCYYNNGSWKVIITHASENTHQIVTYVHLFVARLLNFHKQFSRQSLFLIYTKAATSGLLCWLLSHPTFLIYLQQYDNIYINRFNNKLKGDICILIWFALFVFF